MIFLALTVIICLIVIAMVIFGTARHGWSNLYFVSLGLVVASLALGVVGYLA